MWVIVVMRWKGVGKARIVVDGAVRQHDADNRILLCSNTVLLLLSFYEGILASHHSTMQAICHLYKSVLVRSDPLEVLIL